MKSFLQSPAFHPTPQEVQKNKKNKKHMGKPFHLHIDHRLDHCQDEFNKGFAKRTKPKKLTSS